MTRQPLLVSSTVAEAFRDGFFTNFRGRYRVFKGGRNTGKTHTIIGFEAVYKILTDSRRNILIVRKNSTSNYLSTYQNIKGRIIDLGLRKRFKFVEAKGQESIEYIKTGQKIVFKGMNDPTTLTGINFAVGYLTDVYIEEAFEIDSYDDFNKLDMSLRQKLPAGLFLQITLCLNGWNEAHWINDVFFKGNLEDDFVELDSGKGYQEFRDDQWQGDYGKGLFLSITSYKCNPFRDAEQVDPSAIKMRDRSLERYKVTFLGMWGAAGGQSYPSFISDMSKPGCNVVPHSEIMAGRFHFVDYAIGIDTGLSDGEGRRKKVLKTQSPEERIKSAHAIMLVGVTPDYRTLVVIDEYFHSENERNASLNTDGEGKLGQPELLRRTMAKMEEWRQMYGATFRQTGLFLAGKQTNVAVDSADIGFMQQLHARMTDNGMTRNYRLSPSIKKLTQFRVDFEDMLFAYQELWVSDKCPNAIREFKAAVMGDDGRARTDTDDHCLTALEYGYAGFLSKMVSWRFVEKEGSVEE